MQQATCLCFKNDEKFNEQIKNACAGWDAKKKTVIFIEPYGAVISLLKQALTLGHQVVVFTANSDLRVVSQEIQEAACLTVQVDTANDRQVKKLGQSLAKHWRFDAVIPGFEYFVPTAARLSRILGLPGLSPGKVMNLRSKYLMRLALKKAGLTCPQFVLVKDLKNLPAALKKVGFPAICKPIDAAGSVHVKKVTTLAEAQAVAQRILEGRDLLWGHRLTQALLVEEYVEGKEYSAEGVIQNGKLLHYSLTEKFVADQNEFVEVGHIVNVPLEIGLRKRIEVYLEAVMTALEADHCPFHAELRINREGQPVLMEAAARLAGDRIGDLICLARGVNYMDAVLATYLGQKVLPPTLRNCFAGIRFFYRPELAAYSELEGLDKAEKLTPEELVIYYKPGQSIPAFPKPLRRLGHVMLKSDNYDALAKKIRAIDENLVFKPLPAQVIILHGAYGHPQENWFAWLKQKLEARGVSCEVPTFPTPQGQSLQTWLATFKEKGKSIHSQTILIGHSLGAAFMLRWLEQQAVRIKAAILVGAFSGEVGVTKFDSLNHDFFSKPFDYPLLRERCEHFFCYQGSNDPYVLKEQWESIAEPLQARKIRVSMGGHFNEAAGYRQFPLLLNHLNQLLEQNAC